LCVADQLASQGEGVYIESGSKNINNAMNYLANCRKKKHVILLPTWFSGIYLKFTVSGKT